MGPILLLVQQPPGYSEITSEKRHLHGCVWTEASRTEPTEAMATDAGVQPQLGGGRGRTCQQNDKVR